MSESRLERDVTMASLRELQKAKQIVQDYHAAIALDKGADHVRVKEALKTHYSPEVICQP